MRYDVIGSILVFTAALLYAARYIAAAVIMAPMAVELKGWSQGMFSSAYHSVGSGLTFWSFLALVAGLCIFIVGAVLDARRRQLRRSELGSGRDGPRD